ncbi:MAG: chromate transporter [Beijerinckiaceae bacterium]|nr:chromate transporter [Beijerinckiaceae bacterium]MDO9443180.1 chromate transporter [Beijerinckiaceae bacterium]
MADLPDMTPAGPPMTKAELFFGFLLVGLFGFGGIAAAAHHVIVERRRWLTNEGYAQVLGLGQVLPGANLVNMTTIVGDKFHGFAGAVLALLGLTLMPILILVGLATIYDHFAQQPDVIAATKAAAAGAAGLIFGTGFKLGKTILDSRWAVLFALLSFTSIGILRLPLVQTLLCLAPFAVAVSFWRGSREK